MNDLKNASIEEMEQLLEQKRAQIQKGKNKQELDKLIAQQKFKSQAVNLPLPDGSTPTDPSQSS